MQLSVIIPAYLEEENLRVFLPRVKKTLSDMILDYEILVIDTMSPMDNTEMVCNEFGVNYIRRENGNKYGDAIRTALQRVEASHILFMDADGSHSPEFIKNLYEYKDQYDVVIASRFVEGGGSDNKKILVFMSWAVNFTYSFLFNLKCKDVSNSFKLYNGYLLRNLKLNCDNFDIIEEILIKLKRQNKNLAIKEIPYLFKERMFGHTKRNLVAFMFSYIFTLFKLKFSK